MAAGSLLVDIGLNVARLSQDMGKATRMFAGGMSQMSRDVGFLKNSLVSLVSVGSLVALGKSAIELGSTLTDMAGRSGIAASELSALSYPAKMVGVDLEAVGNAIKFMQKNIAAAENPTSDAALALGILGVKLSELKGKTPTAQFLRLADAFSRLEKDENRTAIALELFGKAGANILPVLDKGAVGLNRMMDAAKDLGIALSEEQIKRLDDYGDAMDRTVMRIKSLVGKSIIEYEKFYDWMTRQDEQSLKSAARIKEMFEGLSDRMGFTSPSVKTGKIADILVESPDKVAARNIEAEKARRKKEKEAAEEAAKEKKRHDEEGYKRQLKLLADRGEVLADFYGDEAKLADIATDQDIERFNKWKEIEDTKIAYAQELRGTMDALGVADPEADLAAAMPLLDEMIAKQAAMTEGMKFDELMNAAMAYGNVSLAIETMNSKLGETQAVLMENQSWIALYQQAWQDAHLAIADAVASLYSGMTSWISSSLQGLITGTMTVMDVLKNLGSMMLSIITEYVAKWVVSRLFMAAMGKTFQAVEIATAIITGGAVAAAWAPAAAMVSLATLGSNSVPAMAGLISTVGLAQMLAIPMLAEGGIVSSPTLVLAGEKGPEAIVPLDSGMGGQQINLYLDGDRLATWMHRASRQGRLNLVPA